MAVVAGEKYVLSSRDDLVCWVESVDDRLVLVRLLNGDIVWVSDQDLAPA